MNDDAQLESDIARRMAMELQDDYGLARRIKARLNELVPGLHHVRVTCSRGAVDVRLRPKDAGRIDEVRVAMRTISGRCALGALVSVVPDRVRCTQHSDCRAHLDLGRACWEASRDR